MGSGEPRQAIGVPQQMMCKSEAHCWIETLLHRPSCVHAICLSLRSPHAVLMTLLPISPRLCTPRPALSHKTSTNRSLLAVARPVAFFCRTRPTPIPRLTLCCAVYLFVVPSEDSSSSSSFLCQRQSFLPSLTLVAPRSSYQPSSVAIAWDTRSSTVDQPLVR